MEREKLEGEHAEVLATIERLRAILDDESLVRDEIRGELLQIRDRYADDRRTQIVAASADLSIEDLIADEEMAVTFSHMGYVKRTSIREYQAQRRGGTGKKGMGTREEDFVRDLFVASTHDKLMVFTSKGQVFLLPVWQVPEGGRAARGTPMVNLLPHVGKDETVATVISIREFDERSLVLVTRSGMIKRSKLSAYRNIRASGIIACSLKDGDEVLSVRLLDDPDGSLLLATAQGKSIHFDAIQAREMGRTARGVIGIRMGDDDQLVGIEVVRPDVTLLTITTNGYGKRTAIGEYRKQNRGGMGLIDIKTEGRNGHVVGVTQVEDNEQVMIVTSGGKIIRTGVHEVSVIGRNTMGVRLIRLDKDEQVVSFARLGEREEDEEFLDENGEVLAQEEGKESASDLAAAVMDEPASEAVEPAEGEEEPGEEEPGEEDETVRLEE